MQQIFDILIFGQLLASWVEKILNLAYFSYFEIREVGQKSKYQKFVACDCGKWFFQGLCQFLAPENDLGLSFFNFRNFRVKVEQRENGYVSPMRPLRREGGVSDQILGPNDSGSKFYVLSHAFDGIWKFCPVLPKMVDTWSPVGVILGVRYYKSFILHGFGVKLP